MPNNFEQFFMNNSSQPSSADPFNYSATQTSQSSSFISKLPGPSSNLTNHLEIALLFQAAQIQRLQKISKQNKIYTKDADRLNLDRHSYEIQIKQLTVLIQDLQKEKNGLKQYIQQINGALDSRMESSKGSIISNINQSDIIKNLKRKYEKALLEIDKMYNDNSDLQDQVNILAKQLHSLQNINKQNNKALSREIQLQAEIKSLRKQLQITQQNTKLYESQINKINRYKFEQYQQKIGLLEKANHQYETISLNYDKQIAHLRIQVQKSEIQLRQLEDQNIYLKKSVNEGEFQKQQFYQNKIAMLSQEIQRLTLLGQNRLNKIDQLQKQIQCLGLNHRKYLNSQDSLLKQKQYERSLEKNRLVQQMTILERQNRRLTQLGNSLKDQISQISRNKQMDESRQNLSNIYRKHIEQLEDKLKQLVGRINEQAKQISIKTNSHEQEQSRLKQQLSRKQIQIQITIKKLKQIQQKYSQQKQINATNIQNTFKVLQQNIQQTQQQINISSNTIFDQINQNSPVRLKNILDCISQQIMSLSKQFATQLKNIQHPISHKQNQIPLSNFSNYPQYQNSSNQIGYLRVQIEHLNDQQKVVNGKLAQIQFLISQKYRNIDQKVIKQIRQILKSNHKLDKINQRNLQINFYLDQQKNKNAKLLQKIEQNERIIHKLQQTRSATQSQYQYKQLYSQIQTKNRKIKQLTQKLESQKFENSQIRQKFHIMEKRIDDYIKVSAQQEQQLQLIRKQKVQLQRNYADLLHKLNNFQQYSSKIVHKISLKFDQIIGKGKNYERTHVANQKYNAYQSQYLLYFIGSVDSTKFKANFRHQLLSCLEP